MLIDAITLTNFRQYKGTNTINFSRDENKNVTVITGENTCGKTTLVQSFIWCLYGKVDFKDKAIINAEVYDELVNGSCNATKEAFVTIRLNHNDVNYIAIRKVIYKLNDNGRITTSEDFKIYEVDSYGNTTPIDADDCDSIVTNILPENLSDYFFFWGERIEKLSEKKELEEAVKQFLGLDTLDSSIKHLTSVVRKMNRDVSAQASDAEVEKLNKECADLEEENEKKIIERDEKIKNADFYRGAAKKLFDELMTSENQSLQQKQTDFKMKSQLCENEKQSLEISKKHFLQDVNDSNNYIYYLAQDMEKEAVAMLKNNPEPVIGWNHIDLSAINEILNRKECICGNRFCEEDHTYKHLLEQRKLVAPNVIGGVINSFVEESSRRNIFNSAYLEKLRKDYKEINEISDKIIDLEYDINILRKAITGKSDLKDKDKKYHEYLDKVSEFEREIGTLQNIIKNNNDEIERKRKRIEILLAKNEKYRKELIQINCAERVLELFKNDYENNKEKLKNKLEDCVNNNFNEVYNGERIIKIDEKYNAVAYNKVGDNWITSETSPGLETVKNFAFIAGLVQCAKEKIIGSDGTEVNANDNSYPLVLDAPFSQADEKHVPAISKLISNNAEQIILVVMGKDWNYAKSILKEKVGKFYKLSKETETHTKILEEKLND